MAAEVARWMLEQLEKDGLLYQEEAVWEIQSRFGESFVYENDRGGLGIAKPVLSEFRKLTPDVVWSRSERLWRKRERGEPEGRQAD